MDSVLTDPARRDIANHLHSFTDPRRHEMLGPVIIESGEGVYLHDSAGRTYLDGMSSLWCATLGYSEERLIEAAVQQMRRLPYSHTFRGRSNGTLIALAEKLIELAPAGLSKAFFASSGSEANESAIKLAWLYNRRRGRAGKRKIIAQLGGYHGSAIFSAALSGISAMHEFRDLPHPDVLHVGAPHHYGHGLPGEDEEAFSSRLASELEAVLLKEGPDSVAAFIAEPVMGVGGVIVPPAGYFPKIQAVLRKYDVLFIADEVICGFGRTGSLFGSQTFAIEPDVITLAKGISSAYFPISAVLVSEAIFEALRDRNEGNGMLSHGFTYSGHPVGAAVSLEAIRIYQERDIPGHVRNVGGRLQQKLRGFQAHPLVGEVRGVGLMAGIQLMADRDAKLAFPAERGVGDFLVAAAAGEGLFLRAVGDTILIAPPLIISDSEVDLLVERFDRALSKTTQSHA